MGRGSPISAGIVRNTLKGIRRTLGTATVQKAPTLIEDVRVMIDATDAGLIGARDRVLILLGFAGAFRRSELVALDFADLAFSRDGLTVTLRRSKTDQEAQGARSASHTARIPIRARFARFNPGSKRRASQTAQPFAPSIATARFRLTDSHQSTWRGS
jgi:integrase